MPAVDCTPGHADGASGKAFEVPHRLQIYAIVSRRFDS